MKSNYLLFHFLLAAVLFANFSLNAGPHEGEAERLEGPNGGRIVKSVLPHLEVYVTEDGVVKVTFLRNSGEVVPPSEQEISLIGGDRMNPVRLSFARSGESLISQGKLPLDEGSIPIVLQVKTGPDAKVVRERFNLNMSECSTCEYKEYACSCH